MIVSHLLQMIIYCIFSSDGREGLGGMDVFRVNLNENSNAMNIGLPVNSEKDDFAFSFNTKQ